MCGMLSFVSERIFVILRRNSRPFSFCAITSKNLHNRKNRCKITDNSKDLEQAMKEQISNDLLEKLNRLEQTHTLTKEAYQRLVEGQGPELAALAAEKADALRQRHYRKDVYIRGLLEIGNACRNDCYYCGIRRSNKGCRRYILSREEILDCCEEGYELGFRTFVLQGGEGMASVDRICVLVEEIKKRYPGCAVTLSLGEYSREDYRRMREAGADRYLLRHETADKAHYEKLHPPGMSFDNRMRCLHDLKDLGFQVGCGFMVGSPFQTPETLAADLKFVEEFQPQMCGIGPFIPQKDTPFGEHPPGTAEQTLYLLSLLRLIKPNLLLPATTALGTISPDGRERGIAAGANVVMPNLSPVSAREKYLLYDNKLTGGRESAQNLRELEKAMEGIGYRVVVSRGDPAI